MKASKRAIRCAHEPGPAIPDDETCCHRQTCKRCGATRHTATFGVYMGPWSRATCVIERAVLEAQKAEET